MARYRVFKQTKGRYKVVGLFTPGKGARTQLVAMVAEKGNLAETARIVASGVKQFRVDRAAAANGASKLEKVGPE